MDFACAMYGKYIGCSVTVNKFEELVLMLKQLCVKTNKNEGGCIKKVLRIKNGYDYGKNKNLKDTDIEYRDIKVNVLVCNQDKTKQIIGEIQFLLNFMLSAKKLGHSVYTVLSCPHSYLYQVVFVDDKNRPSVLTGCLFRL